MISKEDLKNRFKEMLPGAISGDLSDINQIISKNLLYATEHWDELTPDAQQMIDNILEGMQSHFNEAIAKLPDSVQKRQLKRTLALSSGKHFDAKQLIKILESAPSTTRLANEIALEGIFTNKLQNILDLLFDISQLTQTGPASFAQVNLLYMCIDELLAAFHLARHRFINQSYAHIRTVIEHLDKVELFKEQPQWVEVWIGDDEKKIWDELKPGAVRKKLGNQVHDPLYSFLSKLGTHGTFKAVQSRTAMVVPASKDETTKILVWVGGCPLDHNVVWMNALLIHALFRVVLQVWQSFGDQLFQEECLKIVQEMFDDEVKYLKDYFLTWAKEKGLDTSDLNNFLSENTLVNILGRQKKA